MKAPHGKGLAVGVVASLERVDVIIFFLEFILTGKSILLVIPIKTLLTKVFQQGVNNLILG